MSNKAYYFGDANAIARLMKKMYFGVETEVPVYEEREVTTTKQLPVANLGDFFEVTTNTPTTDPWTFADTGVAEVRMAGIKKGNTQYDLTLTAKRALTGAAVDAEYYFSGIYGNLSIHIANTTALNRSYANESKAKTNYWTGTLAAGDTIRISGNHMMSSTSATPLVSVYVTCDAISTTTIEQVQVGTKNKELARKVIRAYQPDANGKAQLWFDADAAGTSVTFTGEHTVQDVTVDGAARKLYTLTGDGVLTVSGTVAYWMIGGGASGENGSDYLGRCTSGNGGCSGYVDTGTLTAGVWQVAIGIGGVWSGYVTGYLGECTPGGATTLTKGDEVHTAAGGTLTAGGTGGGYGGSCNKQILTKSGSAGTGAGISTIPFGLTDLIGKIGAGGGSGIAIFTISRTVYGTSGGSNGESGSTTRVTRGAAPGGATGGGDGGGETSATAAGGAATTPGSGGGGGSAIKTSSSASTTTGRGGAGADGAVWLLV